MTNPKVVILLSDKRSGSTMFQRALCKHPQIRTVDYSPHTYLETHHWLKAAVLLGKHPKTFSNGKTYKGYGSINNAKVYMLDCIKGNVPAFKVPNSDEELVMQGWESLCQQYAQPVFFEKSPQIIANWSALSLLLEWIKQTSFDVKIIGLVRNPMAVQYSAFQLFHTDPKDRQFGWLEIHKNLLAFKNLLPPESFYLLKYEDIVFKPKPTFEKICEFIGLEAHKDVGSKVHAKSLSKWEKDPFFRLQLDESVKQIATYFGYEEKDFYNPIKPLPPWHLRVKRTFDNKLTKAKANLINRIIKPILLRINNKNT